MDIVAFVFARGGSKGLPKKNIKIFCGKPLIGHAIEQAKSLKQIKRVIVSTDCQITADIARSFGADVPFLRPTSLSEDNSAELFAWKHALSYLEDETGHLPDVMVSVPATSPLRKPEDIEACLNAYFSVGPDVVITVTASSRNPYFNMVEAADKPFLRVVCNPPNQIFRRQDAPIVFDMATVAYVANPIFVMTSNSLFEGRVLGVEIPTERAIDIDTQLDFDFAEFIFNRDLNKCKFPS